MRAPLLRPGWLSDVLRDPEFNAHAKQPVAGAGSAAGGQSGQPAAQGSGSSSPGTADGAEDQQPAAAAGGHAVPAGASQHAKAQESQLVEHGVPDPAQPAHADPLTSEALGAEAAVQEQQPASGAAQTDSATAAGGAHQQMPGATASTGSQQQGGADQGAAVLDGQSASSAVDAGANQQQPAAQEQASAVGQEQQHLESVPRPSYVVQHEDAAQPPRKHHLAVSVRSAVPVVRMS